MGHKKVAKYIPKTKEQILYLYIFSQNVYSPYRTKVLCATDNNIWKESPLLKYSLLGRHSICPKREGGQTNSLTRLL
jgi:hypothetical protein